MSSLPGSKEVCNHTGDSGEPEETTKHDGEARTTGNTQGAEGDGEVGIKKEGNDQAEHSHEGRYEHISVKCGEHMCC